MLLAAALNQDVPLVDVSYIGLVALPSEMTVDGAVEDNGGEGGTAVCTGTPRPDGTVWLRDRMDCVVKAIIEEPALDRSDIEKMPHIRRNGQ